MSVVQHIHMQYVSDTSVVFMLITPKANIQTYVALYNCQTVMGRTACWEANSLLGSEELLTLFYATIQRHIQKTRHFLAFCGTVERSTPSLIPYWRKSKVKWSLWRTRRRIRGGQVKLHSF